MLKKLNILPVQLFISVIFACIASFIFNCKIVSAFYTFSILIKDCLMFIIPFIIFTYLTCSLMNIKKNAVSLIFYVFLIVIMANMLNVLFAYFVSFNFFNFFKINATLQDLQSHSQVKEFFKLPLFTINNRYVLILGLVVGIAINTVKVKNAKNIMQNFKNIVTRILAKVFVPLLPLYVFGFILKIAFDGNLLHLFKSYMPIFLLSFCAIQFYIFAIYFLTTFDLKKTITHLKEAMPAWITGFSTMSSALTIPVTTDCVKKITKNEDFANFIVPVTSNIHMAGDGINITVTSLALLVVSGGKIPNIVEFFPYVIAYAITKFSGSGVPGGGMLILLPIVSKYLSLNDTMVSLVATLYIIQDGLMTASNVTGNIGFATLLNNIFKGYFKRKKAKLEAQLT